MTAYEEIINNLKDIKTVVEFYRFQGANSFEYYNIKSNHFDNDSNHYVYFSITENHHYYFTVRRIRQLINTLILRNSPYNISNKCLKDDRAFHYIENLVINSDSLRKLNSIALVCDSIYYELLKENSIYNIKKRTPNLIERLSLYYNINSIDKVIADKISIAVTSYIINRNAPIDVPTTAFIGIFSSFSAFHTPT